MQPSIRLYRRILRSTCYFFQPFQMDELDPLEVCQRCAQEQAQRTVAPAAERDVAAAELAQRRADEVAPVRAPPGQVERLGLLDGIAGLLAPQLAQPLDVQMLQMAGET